MAIGGRRLARSERPYSDARPVIIHGEPAIGTSAPSTGFSSLTTALAASDDAWIALKRAAGSARSVARSTRIADTWLLAESSSTARRLTGTIAISDFSGSRLRSFRKRRSAPLHIAITTVLTVPPTCLPSAFTSASGSDSALYERWFVIDTLKMLFGARPSSRLRAPGAVRRAARMLPTACNALAACGSMRPSLVYCATELEIAACSSSATPS